MSLAPGARLGAYEVVSLLGAGGMGEVYKARDTRLARTVAIKVLRAHLAADPDRRARFEREARLVSQLNHPNICTLYDLGQDAAIDYLVIEYLEGQTLAERLRRGRLPIEQALTIATQIADALDAAHRKGIVHRDLKPDNVMLTRIGAKLLDFGIARLTATPAGGPTATVETALTVDGRVLGTVPYMSPEQLEGRAADARSDIFAFGALLYEMLTGVRAFQGNSQSIVAAAILDGHPQAVSRVLVRTPPLLDHLVATCLAKSPERRWQSAGDIARQIEWIASDAERPPPVGVAQGMRRIRLGWIVALALLIASAMAVTWRIESTTIDAPQMRVQVVTPSGSDLTSFALSPDGRTLAFRATAAGRTQLWLKGLDDDAARPLAGTDEGDLPFWSPDDRSLGFFANSTLKRIDIANGSVQTLAAAPNPYLGTWGTAGTILFTPNTDGPVYRVASTGGDAVAVTRLTPGQTEHRTPRFLPDGRHFLFFVWGTAEARGVYLGSLDSGESRRLFGADGGPAEFLAPDYVVYAREGALVAQRIDLRTLASVGDPIAIAAHVAATGVVGLSVSASGSLAYRPERETTQLAWLDRSGRQIATLGEPDRAPRGFLLFSPDRQTMVLSRRIDGIFNLWMVDTAGGLQRLTFDSEGNKFAAVWSPDGKRLVFNWDPTGVLDLYARGLGGEGARAPLLSSNAHKHPTDWSSDGRFVLYTSNGDVWALPLAGDHTLIPVAQTAFREGGGRFSPDGRWIAYQSNETGRAEIYVQPFPGPGPKSKVSSGGGVIPEWRADGRELFYLAPDDQLMAVSIAFGTETTRYSKPIALFTLPPTPKTVELRQGAQYSAMADGQHFLVNKILVEPPPITLLLNWKPPSAAARR